MAAVVFGSEQRALDVDVRLAEARYGGVALRVKDMVALAGPLTFRAGPRDAFAFDHDVLVRSPRGGEDVEHIGAPDDQVRRFPAERNQHQILPGADFFAECEFFLFGVRDNGQRN